MNFESIHLIQVLKYYQSKINKRHIMRMSSSSAKVMSKSGNNNCVHRTGLV